MVYADTTKWDNRVCGLCHLEIRPKERYFLKITQPRWKPEKEKWIYTHEVCEDRRRMVTGEATSFVSYV